MKTSLLICAHSQDEWHDNMLAYAIGSVRRQTILPDEIIIVLDECWDGTSFAVNHALGRDESPFPMLYDRTQIVKRPKKEGLAFAKNFGIERCTGEWITFLDADDAWMPYKLADQLGHADYWDNEGCGHGSGQSVDFFGTLAWDRTPMEGVEPQWWALQPSCFRPYQYRKHDEIVARIQKENVLCHGSMMIRSEALRALGGYHDVRGAEDWDLWKRAIKAGYYFYNIPERLYIWTHSTSVER